MFLLSYEINFKGEKLTGGPYNRTFPGRGRLCELNHITEAGDNNTTIPTFKRYQILGKVRVS